ncbi:MAG: hypothetical protein ABEJ68_06635 [Halobacteriaceae archaeon]
MTRGQANLVALAVAMLLLTAAIGVTLAVATGAFATADANARDRAAAAGVAERLVAADGSLTVRENVLNGSEVATLDAEALRAAVPATRDRAVRVRLDGETLVETGDPTGPTVRRLVLVERRRTITRTVAADMNGTFRVAPTGVVTVTVERSAGVETITANGRVVAHDPVALNGTIELDVRRDRPTALAFNGSNPTGTVRVRTHPWETEQAVLEVTVDA